MKNNNNIGLVILGVAILISAIILANSNNHESHLQGDLNGSLNGSFTTQNEDNLFTMDDVIDMLGYSDKIVLLADLTSDNVDDFPYLKVKGSYVFNKKAVEEWIYKKSKEQTIIK